MKNIIVRRVTLLMFITLFFSSILVSFLSLLFSEGMKADYRGKEFVPDLSVLTEFTIQYQKGNLSKDTYEDILMNASKEYVSEYMVINPDGTAVFATKGIIDPSIKTKIEEALIEVLNGDEIYQKMYESTKKPAVLIGVPVIENNKSTGAIFALLDMTDLLQERKRFYKALVISMIIVIPLGIGFSYLVLKRIVKPIKNVVTVALSMVEGDFSIRADETLKGEVGLLGRTINKLSVDLYKNVSELYIEKNRLYQVLNSLEEGMIAVDERRCITHFNKVFLEMFGLEQEKIKGKCVDDIGILNEELYELSQVIEGKYSVIKNCTNKDVVMRVVIASIEDEKNISVGAVVLFRDITEIEKLETMRKDYVSNVSHELRSPLTSIRGLIEPLMDSIVTDEVDIKRYYEIIYKESLRLSRLVDDIMELSRLQTNDAIIDKTSVNLNSIIEMVYDRFKILDGDINLIYNPVSIPKVYTNYDRIEQVMVILLDNAYKFTPKGGQIEILTEARANDVLVIIKDNGVGIDREDLPFIFDRFYKSDKSRSKRGTGLGLSIAKEILNIMGEEINVKSEHGKGSSFEFTVQIENK
ncbi:PAS domain S-box-containing protein [Sedimentibacter acidaminivorans]|uniref:histidine kinase n=1 Tax=Sedimentibacter acidaminivorans TaxID=913099 RepID=A0ABS4GGW6_9FIRM|nr:ATP-binding protein [Sedimentibacter acidaminivorans]MBP1926936.1 PAS domain S-box-containing protein [Sedimentibacter acidaminivorans]